MCGEEEEKRYLCQNMLNSSLIIIFGLEENKVGVAMAGKHMNNK